MHTRGSPGVSWAAEDQCGGGGGECDGTGDAMLGGVVLLSFQFLLYIPYLAQPENCVRSTSVSESKSSAPPWHASQPASITKCLVFYSAQSGTRHRQQGEVSLIAEAKKGAW